MDIKKDKNDVIVDLLLHVVLDWYAGYITYEGMKRAFNKITEENLL